MAGRLGSGFLHLSFQSSELFISGGHFHLKFFVNFFKIFLFDRIAELGYEFALPRNLCLHGLDVLAVADVLRRPLPFFSDQLFLQKLNPVLQVHLGL